ncbi:MAG: hypothetical protein LC768_03080 [Acidobacteria bacterium]|nr:hypothetical protein [Acidobacteriota bacterium]MCA1637315.1 hypothetical protein [Acidobacteriota bacterium]
MFSSNSVKFFFVFTAMLSQACSFWQDKTNATPTPTPFLAEKFASEIPFSTKEPDVYQAEIVLTNYENGEKKERKIIVARSGGKTLHNYETGIYFLQLNENENLLAHSRKKIYADSQTNLEVSAQNDETLQGFLSEGWLNQKTNAKFENLGAENNLTKYRVVLASSQTSELMIYIDENFKIPVRQEFYSINGEQKNMIFSMEIRNLKMQTDEKLFEIPKDFKKVSFKEFQKIIWQEKFDQKK